MAINESLIKGAGAVNQGFVNVAGAVGAGLQAGLGSNSSAQNQLPRRAQKRNKIDNINAQVKAHIDSLNTDMDLVGLSDEESAYIRGYLDTRRMEFAQLASELAQTDATSPYYSQLKSQMDGIKNSFVTLGKQVEAFKKRKVEYMQDFDQGMFSKGNNPEQYELAAKVYAGGSLNVGEDGQLYVVTDRDSQNGGNIVRYSEIKDPSLVDRKSANLILSNAEKLNKSGNLISDFEAQRLKNETIELLQQEGTLESIVEDGVLSSMPLNVDLDDFETRQEAVEAVADIIVNGYKDSAKSGYNAKQAKKTSVSKKTTDKNEIKSADSQGIPNPLALKGAALKDYQLGYLAFNRVNSGLQSDQTPMLKAKDGNNMIIGMDEQDAAAGPTKEPFFVQIGGEEMRFDTQEKAVRFAMDSSGENEIYLRGYMDAQKNTQKPQTTLGVGALN